MNSNPNKFCVNYYNLQEISNSSKPEIIGPVLKGLFIVASAGNEPTGKPIYPAAYSSVIGIGALRPDGKKWGKSNYGDFVEFEAPGFAKLPVGYKGEPGIYAGTSISAAFVARFS